METKSTETSAERRILIADDDPDSRIVVASVISILGHSPVVVHGGGEALEECQRQLPDLAIIDYTMPAVNGIEMCHRLKTIPGGELVPILMLTARDSMQDKISALEEGVDDYLTKPFGVGELEARVRALFRRRRNALDLQPIYSSKGLNVDFANRRVTRNGEEVHLTPIEYRLLAVLVKNAGVVVTHRNLLRQVWGPGHGDDIQYLRIYMGQLRHKLEEDPARPRHLQTEIGVGYRLLQAE